MVREIQDKMRHVSFLLNELEAELKSLEAADDAVKALAQLNEREAQGEPLVEVCSTTLRSALAIRVATSPVTVGLKKLTEMRTAIANAGHTPVAAEASTASPSVIDLGERRDQKQTTTKPKVASARPLRGFGHAIAVSLALTAMTAAGLTQLPTIGRIAIIDIAGTNPASPPLASRFAAIDGF